MPLKKKKRYYVRIRPYIKNDSKKYYGKWSKVKSVKIKKRKGLGLNSVCVGMKIKQ